MSPYNPCALAAVCALCLLAAAVIGRRNGFYRGQLAAEGGRFESIDGLRGFLALGVFGEHAMSMHGLLASGTWAADVAPFFLQASRAGVAMFFMITAFLFSLRVLRSGDSFGTRAFFTSRIRRLTPMYAFSVLMTLAVVFSASGLALRVPLPELLRELRPWLSFGFMTTGPLNGVADAHAINAVYWTLGYEWMFYLALPLLALFARGPWSALPLLAVLYFGATASMVYNFLFGALAALFVHWRVLEPRRFLESWLVPLPFAALGAYFALAAGEHRLAESALLFVFFLFVVHGYDALGLLHTRPAKLLGMVSYSLYLTHCIVLYVVMHAADRMVAVASLSALQYLLLAALAALGAVAVSCVTYRYVEFPFIHPQPQSNTNRNRRDSWTRRLISGW